MRIIGEIVWTLVLIILVGMAVGFAAGMVILAEEEAGIAVGICSMAAWLIYRRWRSKFDGSERKSPQTNLDN